ncbi:MAG TPA: histidine--tRNA ligase [Lentisphaeria bacterium]|nr:MAG: histidine--tRNA ligase [Lentisphaerae bacterium GWF2_49_21]HBC85909.1 histidine--tRNA ligase [Lentisphaeria bacterium]
MSKFSPPPGTSDIFPEEISCWHSLEDAARRIFPLYGYAEMRTPVFEYTEVFKKGIGDETEVVQKEMYTFEDRGGRSLTLRPEGTAGIIRSLAGTDVMNGNEKRVYYIGPMFRGERPAAGRRRQFHQIGAENAGRVAPELDAESIALLLHYLDELGITGYKLLLNTRASSEDRKPAEDSLRAYFANTISGMCPDCKNRLERNVWRILDCKQEQCRDAISKTPDIAALFGEPSRKYFEKVCAALSAMGIHFEVDSRLVRGLDYYVHTVFEVTHPGLGAQNAIAGGGRYEINVPESDKAIVGVGFAAGLERLIMAQQSLGVKQVQENSAPLVFLIGLGEKARNENLGLAARLRRSGISTGAEVEEKSMKACMRGANRVNAKFTVIRGDNELAKGSVVLKNMADGSQTEMNSDALLPHLKSLVK